MTVADERLRIPENSEVVSIIRNTAKVMPSSSAANLVRSRSGRYLYLGGPRNTDAINSPGAPHRGHCG